MDLLFGSIGYNLQPQTMPRLCVRYCAPLISEWNNEGEMSNLIGPLQFLLEDGVDDVVDTDSHDFGQAHRLVDVLPHYLGQLSHTAADEKVIGNTVLIQRFTLLG